MQAVSAESASHILSEVEMETKRVLGSFGLKEYDALTMVKLPTGVHLNRTFV
jgi:hypothetical protein